MSPDTQKLRVYIGFYPRQQGDFHSGLLVVPKSPKPTTEAWRFDVHDLPIKLADGSITLRWTYGHDRSFDDSGRANVADKPGIKVYARSKNLVGAMLVGKLKPSVSVEDLRVFARDAVDISQHSPEDKSKWVCHQWVMEVLDAMNANEFFSKPLAQDGSALWTKANAFVDKVDRVPDYTRPLPTCDDTGAAIKAEIPQAPNLIQS